MVEGDECPIASLAKNGHNLRDHWHFSRSYLCHWDKNFSRQTRNR